MTKKSLADFANQHKELEESIEDETKELLNSQKGLELKELQERIKLIDEMNIKEHQKDLMKDAIITNEFLKPEQLAKKAKALRLDIFKQVDILSDLPDNFVDLASKKRIIEVYNATLKVGYFIRTKKEHLEYNIREVLMGNIEEIKSTTVMKAMYSVTHGQSDLTVYREELHAITRSANAIYAFFLMIINDSELQELFFEDLDFSLS